MKLNLIDIDIKDGEKFLEGLLVVTFQLYIYQLSNEVLCKCYEFKSVPLMIYLCTSPFYSLLFRENLEFIQPNISYNFLFF